MPRTTEMIGFSVPPALRREVERLSREERRTKSELFREMFRVYQRHREQRKQEDEQELRWVNRIIEEAQREEREHPMTREEALAESKRLARFGARQAKKLGLKTTPDAMVELIHEFRAQRRNA